MYGFYQDGIYSDSRRRRNRLMILIPTIAVSTIGIVSAAFGQYEVESLMALLTLVALFSSTTWWAFGSKLSGPAKIHPKATEYIKRLFTHQPNRR